MNQVAILYPVFVQVLLTVVIYFLLLAARARAISADGKRGSGDIAMGRYAWPEDAEKRAHSQRNQFELPVLFYAVSAFALVVGGVDLTMLALAWVFVASRILHATIHIGPNKVRWRGPAFVLGFLIVIAMWAKLFLHVAMSST
ncbi:MAG: MAPEG family protein [Hyphomicrobiaceae bacterium]